MNATRWERLQEMVVAAAEVDPAGRSAWLAQACGGDASFEQQARRMLENFIDDDGSLESAVAEGIAEIADEQHSRREITAGDQIGAYSIVRHLASGGMGSVFLAERQDEHFRESVAIKVVHTSAHMQASLLTRFRIERQVLAAIRHPNIASLLDGGVTSTGLPYLVMEYIDGEDLLTFVQKRALSERTVLDLFRTVCAAVQHAHQNLVVHRDLKPGNILVTRDGQAKLLDFGIAKLLGDTVAIDLPAQTMAADRLLTLQYASPEQLTGAPVTTATDVYGLGATLYELLTGEPPFAVVQVSLAEAQKLICSTAPIPPSLRAERKRPARRDRKPNDLDRVLLKALHKTPERRYTSAAEFSEDLGRYLTGFPVRARPDSVAYRMSRFVRRHVLAVGLTAATVVTLLVLLVLLSVQSRRARREAASADAVAAYLTALFDQAQPDQTHGRAVSARQLLDHGTAELGSKWNGEPLVKARLLSALGRIYYQLGEPTQADNLLAQAANLYAAHTEADPAQVVDNAATIGNVAMDRGDLERAEQQFRRALAVVVRTDGRYSSGLAEQLDNLGQVQSQRGEYDEAARNLLKAGEIHDRLQGPLGADTLADKHNLESVYAAMGQYHRAEMLLREVMDADGRSNTSEAKTLTASDVGNLAYLLDRQGRLRESYPLLLRAVEAHQSLFGKDHPRTVLPLLQLGWYQREVGDLNLAAETTQHALEIARKAEGEMSAHTAYGEDYLGLVLLDQGKTVEARRLLTQARKTREQRHASLSLQAQSLDHLALVDLAEGHADTALAGFSAAQQLRQHAFPHPNDWLAISSLHCAEAELALNRLANAEHDNAEARRMLQESFGATDHPLIAEALSQQGKIEGHLGNVAEAHAASVEADAMQNRIFKGADAPVARKTGHVNAYSR